MFGDMGKHLISLTINWWLVDLPSNVHPADPSPNDNKNIPYTIRRSCEFQLKQLQISPQLATDLALVESRLTAKALGDE